MDSVHIFSVESVPHLVNSFLLFDYIGDLEQLKICHCQGPEVTVGDYGFQEHFSSHLACLLVQL